MFVKDAGKGVQAFRGADYGQVNIWRRLMGDEEHGVRPVCVDCSPVVPLENCNLHSSTVGAASGSLSTGNLGSASSREENYPLYTFSSIVFDSE